MFKSKRRPIVIPQSEQLRLVGTLALLWGNAEFDRPPIAHQSMIAGMGLHDRGYGLLDNNPIGEMSDDIWIPIARRSFTLFNSDVVADTIVKYHFRRLARHSDSAERQALAAEFSQVLAAQLAQHQLSKELFDRIDRITNFTDSVSFDFCFDAPASGSVLIFPKNDEDRAVSVQYQVEEGVIRVDPWPFSVEEYRGYLFAYHREGYPERLDPFILPYHLKRD